MNNYGKERRYSYARHRSAGICLLFVLKPH
jgi:hypothetical protein